jgi:hypothetical protein
MLVQPKELITELYPEIAEEITRGNDDEIRSQLKAAEAFCKSYLFKYDLNALFGTDETEPSIVDENLKKAVKVVASYWLVRKANPNVNVELFREDWQMMIGTKAEPGWLTQIKEGYLNPNWPYKPDDPATPDVDESQPTAVSWSSNTKRRQRF